MHEESVIPLRLPLVPVQGMDVLNHHFDGGGIRSIIVGRYNECNKIFFLRAVQLKI